MLIRLLIALLLVLSSVQQATAITFFSETFDGYGNEAQTVSALAGPRQPAGPRPPRT